MKTLINFRAKVAPKRQNGLENKTAKTKVSAEETEWFKTSFFSNMTYDNDCAPLSLINNIIDTKKLNTGEMQLQRSPININAMMDRLYNMFLSNPVYMYKSAFGKNGVEMKCDKLNQNIVIISDPERLYQIMVHLIDNALKFTESGTVRFGYTTSINDLSKNQYITFYVKDSGIGIPNDKTEMIYERYVQLNDTLSRRHNGVGLGLSISKGLADLMNGKLWCTSTVGKGSNFYFKIPYSRIYALPDTTQNENSYTSYHLLNLIEQ